MKLNQSGSKPRINFCISCQDVSALNILDLRSQLKQARDRESETRHILSGVYAAYGKSSSTVVDYTLSNQVGSDHSRCGFFLLLCSQKCVLK